MDTRRFHFVLCCFVLSGMAGLIYQIAWTQQLSYLFGASSMAIVAVLSAYMAGLTSGALLFRRFAHLIRSPVLVYAGLEAAIALSALLIPTAMKIAGALYISFFRAVGLPPSGDMLGAVAFNLIASFLILFIPTCLMGATLPLLAGYAVRKDTQIGPRVGRLYTANSLGAALGALITSFFLLPAIGLSDTVYAAIATNGLVVVCLLFHSIGGSSPRFTAANRRSVVQKGPIWILPLILMSGFVSFTLEIFWSRLLTHVLGGSLYAFGSMLAVFLIGIALGSAAASRFSATKKQARIGFVAAQIGTALLSVGALVTIDFLFGLSSWTSFDAEGLVSNGKDAVGPVLLCIAAMLPGTLCVGASFPFAVRILAGDANGTSGATAIVLVWNTIGCSLGAILTGLFVLPILGFSGTIALAGLSSLGLACLACLVEPPRLPAGAAVAALFAFALVLFPPKTPWSILLSSAIRRSPIEKEDVLYLGVGRSSTVLLVQHRGYLLLLNDGLMESFIPPPGSHTGMNAYAELPSLLPLAARPGIRSMFVIGLGGGHTVERIPDSVEEIHVVELESKIMEANRRANHWRQSNPLADSRISIHRNDARAALALSGRRFDAIISQPSYPWNAGTSGLLTKEFFELVRNRLTPQGIFVQYLGLKFVDESLLRTLMATVHSVFPHVELYKVYQQQNVQTLLLMASKTPFDIEETAETAISKQQDQWRSMGIECLEDLLIDRVLNDKSFAGLEKDAAVNTDDYNLFRFKSFKSLVNPLKRVNPNKLFALHDSLGELPRNADALYIVMRLIEHGQIGRAFLVTRGIRDAKTKNTAFALLEAASGDTAGAVKRLIGVLKNNRSATPALHALVSINLKAIVELDGSPIEGDPLMSDPAAAAVIEGFRLAKAKDFKGIEKLEPALAGIERKSVLFKRAADLRIKWRAASGVAERAREAIDLLDPLMFDAQKSKKMLLRAELGIAASQPEIAMASLLEFARMHENQNDLNPRYKQLFDLLRGAPRDTPLRITRNRRLSTASDIARALNILKFIPMNAEKNAQHALLEKRLMSLGAT